MNPEWLSFFYSTALYHLRKIFTTAVFKRICPAEMTYCSNFCFFAAYYEPFKLIASTKNTRCDLRIIIYSRTSPPRNSYFNFNISINCLVTYFNLSFSTFAFLVFHSCHTAVAFQLHTWAAEREEFCACATLAVEPVRQQQQRRRIIHE